MFNPFSTKVERSSTVDDSTNGFQFERLSNGHVRVKHKVAKVEMDISPEEWVRIVVEMSEEAMDGARENQMQPHHHERLHAMHAHVLKLHKKGMS